MADRDPPERVRPVARSPWARESKPPRPARMARRKVRRSSARSRRAALRRARTWSWSWRFALSRASLTKREARPGAILSYRVRSSGSGRGPRCQWARVVDAWSSVGRPVGWSGAVGIKAGFWSFLDMVVTMEAV